MKKHQTVIILDVGSRHSQSLSRFIRGLNVYCQILPYSTPIEDIIALSPIAIMLANSHDSSLSNKCLDSHKLLTLDIPILAINYGAQLLANLIGAQTDSATNNQQQQKISYCDDLIFDNIDKDSFCWIATPFLINKLPEGAIPLAKTTDYPIVAFKKNNLYGLMFCPESKLTIDGQKIITNFLFNIAKAKGDWNISDITKEIIADIKSRIGDKKALCAMSGGVDSAVAATLVHKAIGDNLICVFVDHGLLRKNEAQEVMHCFKTQQGMNLYKIDAAKRFLSKLDSVVDPEQKRKIIGQEFIRVFEEEAKKLGKIDFLVQGTIYTDIIESGFGDGDLIKSHHNVGGLPSVIDFQEIIEPLEHLFKDEVRKVGFELGLSSQVVMRQPFPGPGLAIRIIGDITQNKLDILKEADYIMNEELVIAGIDKDIWQYFAVLTNLKSVGVKNNKRTYEYTLGLRAVTSIDAMTADFARIPYEILAKISSRIINEVEGINRVVYDITSKPPSTIEWE